MQKFCLIGNPLTHSLSPLIHGHGGLDYCLNEIRSQDIAAFFAGNPFDAFNVTVPYKEAVIPYLSGKSDAAKEIGAVNTVIKKDGKYYGENTDALGLRYALFSCGITLFDKRVMILGGGGTSKTAVYVAKAAKAKEITVVSRRGQINYDNCYSIGIDVIINTTPVGMYPETECAPIELSRFKNVQGVFDCIYNPLETALLREARRLGITCGGGLSMLVAQALHAQTHFTGRQFNEDAIEETLCFVKKNLKNIALIGMPSAGKSVIGGALASLTGKEFIDTDKAIEKTAGMSIPEIFSLNGENSFRNFEEKEVKIACGNLGKIIATGGGAVLRENNRAALKNCFTVWLKRDINLLETAGRPLSRDKETLEKMYAEREPLYALCADYIIENDGEIANIAKKIKEAYEKSFDN